MSFGGMVLKYVIVAVTLVVVFPFIFGIMYITQGFWIAGLVAIACAPAILWVIIIGWKHASWRSSLNIQLYSSSAVLDAGGQVGGYGYSSSGSEQQASGLCRYCDTPMNPSSPICPKCGRKN